MTEQRTPEAVLHTEFRRNPARPCRPDVVFSIEGAMEVTMPFEQARALAGGMMIQFLQYEEMLREKAQGGARDGLTARLCRKARQWLRK